MDSAPLAPPLHLLFVVGQCNTGLWPCLTSTHFYNSHPLHPRCGRCLKCDIPFFPKRSSFFIPSFSHFLTKFFFFFVSFFSVLFIFIFSSNMSTDPHPELDCFFNSDNDSEDDELYPKSFVPLQPSPLPKASQTPPAPKSVRPKRPVWICFELLVETFQFLSRIELGKMSFVSYRFQYVVWRASKSRDLRQCAILDAAPFETVIIIFTYIFYNNLFLQYDDVEYMKQRVLEPNDNPFIYGRRFHIVDQAEMLTMFIQVKEFHIYHKLICNIVEIFSGI